MSYDNNYNNFYSNDDMPKYGDSNQSFSNNYYDSYSDSRVVKTALEENVLKQSFLFMAIALVITGFSALYVYNSPRLLINILYNPTLLIGLFITEIVIVLLANFAVRANAIVPSGILFTLYSVINGVTLSTIFILYTTSSIVSVFFITAGMFAAMAIYGITTKRDLSSIGSYCFMALIGLIIATLVNTFLLKSAGFDMLLNYAGVAIFVGLTVYDVQKIKSLVGRTDSENTTCIALIGALELYLDFINLFLRLLSILGKHRD